MALSLVTLLKSVISVFLFGFLISLLKFIIDFIIRMSAPNYKRVRVKREGYSFNATIIRSAYTSLGYTIYLFHNDDVVTYLANSYIVAVKDADGNTVSYTRLLTLQRAITYYLDQVCCYA